jgi:hypothetical protein
MKKLFWLVWVWAACAARADASDEYVVRAKELPAGGFTAASFTGGGPSNEFPRIKGSYNGLIAPTNEFVAEYSGFFTFTVDSDRWFRGWMNVGDRRYPLRGRFDRQGSAGVAIYRRDWDDWYYFYELRLIWLVDLRLIAGSDQIEGTVENIRGGWSSELSGHRGHGRTDGPAPAAGRYTLRLPGSTDAAVAPSGSGYGVVKVTTRGRVTAYGALADGTSFSRSAILSTNGNWPFYLPLSDGRGVLMGWLNFTSSPGGDVAGDLIWVRPRRAGRKYYPDGYSGMVAASGARYTPPASSEPALTWTDGAFRWSGGNLAAPAANAITLLPGGKLRDNGGDVAGLSFRLSRSTGVFRGRFVHPESGRRTAYAGILDPLQDVGAGYFLGADQGGRVNLEPAP